MYFIGGAWGGGLLSAGAVHELSPNVSLAPLLIAMAMGGCLGGFWGSRFGRRIDGR
jgi:hypothetical protein